MTARSSRAHYISACRGSRAGKGGGEKKRGGEETLIPFSIILTLTSLLLVAHAEGRRRKGENEREL